MPVKQKKSQMSPTLVASIGGITIKMWQEENNSITKEFKFPDFKTALVFVNKVGRKAEEHNHHPDIELSWGRVKILLSTHSEGKVTDKDRQLAQAIDTLVASASR
jgi:4a-hydroxytetrahydrobiopterin dehydratase